ncbi:acyltransferase [soil metagenome]
MDRQQTRSTQVIGLDLIRFAAAMFVLLFHFTAWSWLAEGGSLYPLLGPEITFPALANWTWVGWAGVDIFFVLSGFVIPFSAEGRGPAKFAQSRALRLAPAAWVCAAISVASMVFIGIYSAKHGAVLLVKSAVFWPFGPWADGQFWTLGIEISFYLVVFAAIARNAFDRIGLIVGTVGIASSALWLASLFNSHLRDFMASRWAELFLLTYGCLFATGLQIWLIRRRGLTLQRTAILAILLIGVSIETYSAALRKLNGMSMPTGAGIAVLFVLGGIGLILLSIAFNERISRVLGKSGATVSRQLGLVTYPLYLLHASIGVVAIRALTERGLPAWLSVVITTAGLVFLSAVIALVLEPWIRTCILALPNLRRRPVVAAPDLHI